MAEKSTARKVEAKEEDGFVTFEYNGVEYKVASNAMDNLELFEAVEDEKFLTAARGFVGKEQWEKFKDSHRTPDGRVPMEPVEGFLEALMAAIGTKDF
jgi:hypothetical protein